MLHQKKGPRSGFKKEDIDSWVTHNRPQYHEVYTESHTHVRFDEESISDDENSQSSDEPDERPNYLNGGYGWVVVLFSFCLHFILDGASFSFGVIFPQIQERFKQKRAGASYVASLFLALPLLLAPVAGLLTDLLDCRRSIILGGVICAVSTLLSYFTDSPILFTILFGGGNGLGMSLIYNAAIVIVTYYFEERRGLATALAVMGTGIGTMMFPFYLGMMGKVVSNALHSSVIALFFAFLVVVAIGLLVKDVEWISDTKEYKEKCFRKFMKRLEMQENDEEENKFRAPLRGCLSEPSLSTTRTIRRLESTSVVSIKDAVEKIDAPTRSRSVATFRQRNRKLGTIPEYTMINATDLEHLANLEHLDLQATPSTTIHSRKSMRILSKTSMSVDHIDELVNNDFPILFSSTSSSSKEEKRSNLIEKIFSEKDDSSSTSDSDASTDGDSSSSELSTKINEVDEELLKTRNSVVTSMQRKPTSARDAEKCQSVPATVRQTRTSLAPGLSGMNAGRVMAGNAIQKRRGETNLVSMRIKMPSAPSLVVRKKRRDLFFIRRKVKPLDLLEKNRSGLLNHFVEEAKSYKEILQVPVFVMYLISVSCLYAVLDVPYVFFFDYVTQDLKISSDDAAFLNVMIGISNCFSTTILGLLSDTNLFKKNLFAIYGIGLTGVAVSMASAAIVSTFQGMMIVCILFGILISTNYVMQSILLTVLFDDMNYFQSAYSLTSFCAGLATLVGPPVIGYVRDVTGTYKYVFVMASVLCTISGAIPIIIHIMLKNEEINEKPVKNNIHSPSTINRDANVELDEISSPLNPV